MILLAILILLCGVLAASALIVQKKPNAAELIAKLVPAQGVMGAILFLWSLWILIETLLHLNAYRLLMSLGGFKYTFAVMMQIISAVVGLLLGFLLAYGLLDKYVFSKNAGAAEKAIAMRAKLTKIQIPLGLAGIACGVLGFIAAIMARG